MIASDVLKRLKENSDFEVFSKFVKEKINFLNNVEGLGQLSNQEAGEEVKVRAATILKLQQILDPVINFVEKENNISVQREEKEKKYGLK